MQELLRPSEQRVMDALEKLANGSRTITNTKLEIARASGYNGSEQAAKQRVGRVLLALENAGRISRSYEPITASHSINLL